MNPIAQAKADRRSGVATESYVLLMLALFPVFTGRNGYVYLQLKKYLFFFAATGLWWLFLSINGILRLLHSRRIPPLTMPALCIAAFAVLAAASTVCSDYAVFFSTVVGKYDSLLTYLLYACILFGVSRYGADLQRCLWAFAASYTVCCAIALLQLCGWNALGFYPEGYTYHSAYVQETSPFLGPLGNIDVFSALHCMALPLFAGTVAFWEKKRRFLLLLPIGMGLTCQIAAGVASGLLALGLTALILPPVFLSERLAQNGAHPAWRWLRFGGVLLLALALGALYALPFRNGTLSEFHRVLHGELLDEFGSNRIRIWRESTFVLRRHLLLGIGPDTLRYYLDILFERYSEVLGETLRATVDNAHNAYLQLLLNFGLLGVIPLSVLMTETWYEIVTQLRDARTMRVLCLPMFCYLIQAFFNNATCIVAPLFLILWGLVLHEGGGAPALMKLGRGKENGTVS